MSVFHQLRQSSTHNVCKQCVPQIPCLTCTRTAEPQNSLSDIFYCTNNQLALRFQQACIKLSMRPFIGRWSLVLSVNFLLWALHCVFISDESSGYTRLTLYQTSMSNTPLSIHWVLHSIYCAYAIGCFTARRFHSTFTLKSGQVGPSVIDHHAVVCSLCSQFTANSQSIHNKSPTLCWPNRRFSV